MAQQSLLETEAEISSGTKWSSRCQVVLLSHQKRDFMKLSLLLPLFVAFTLFVTQKLALWLPGDGIPIASAFAILREAQNLTG